MDYKRVKEILSMEPADKPVSCRGWVRTKRDTKNLTFFELNDGSCLKSLQVIVDRSNTRLEESIKDLSTGASAAVTGIVKESPGENQPVEMEAGSIEVIGLCPPETYPLQKKRHSFEFLREIAHLRPRTNTFGAVTRVRNTLSYGIHRYFQERGYYYVHTPVITASDAEGAGQMFQVTTLPLDKIDAPRSVDYSQDFFGKRSFLTVSGQLNAEIYASALERVYTFGPTFRAENSNTARHLAEFWMIEPEISFCDIQCNMDIAEEFLKYIINAVLTECVEDMEFFNLRIQKGLIDTLEKIKEARFTRISYTEAVDHLKKSGRDFEFPVEWGKDLQSEHEKFLTEEVFHGPVIVTDYPKEIKAFYMKINDDEKTVRGMDVLVPRLGEIIGGSERENRYEILERRIVEEGLNKEDYWWYLELRKYGSVPHSGFGLGFERLIQYITGMQNIRDVIPFPRAVKSISF